MIDDVLKEAMLFEGGIEAIDVVENNVAFLFLLTVAGDAVFLEEGARSFGEFIGPERRDGEGTKNESEEQAHWERIPDGMAVFVRE